MKDRRLGIGIDTGGTYTDVVLTDLDTGELLGSAKSPTTHFDLSLGISRSLRRVVDDSIAAGVELVAVSTTLATNAVVEGKGAAVGLVLIGTSREASLPVVGTTLVRGGHKINGDEECELDIEGILRGVQDMKGRAQAYAVCSAMSFANPAHELVAQKALGMTDDKPVFCSHIASNRAGMRERAATAVLNARLMPVMRQFTKAVGLALDEVGIDARIDVVRGDATSMGLRDAERFAAATFASGPAASVRFGMQCAESPDALVVDVGGTTTDIALIRDGKPVLTESGSMIANLETHITAVEMYTVGVGGDSLVKLAGDGVTLGPDRVVPLAVAQSLPDPAEWLSGKNGHRRLILPVPGVVGELAQTPVMRHLMEHGGATVEQLLGALRMGSVILDQELERLSRAEAIAVSGFTPTDALQVQGRLDIGDREASLAGVRILSQEMGVEVDAFCDLVIKEAEQRIATAIVEHAARRTGGGNLAQVLTGRRTSAVLDVTVTLKVPVVGIGAASRMLLPGAAALLGTEALFPEHCEVGNALGAVLLAAQDDNKE